ncbi:unnamed protein product, partial [Rotaria sp. Silwood2]
MKSNVYLLDCHNDAIFTDDIKSDGLFGQNECSKNSAVTLYVNGKQIAVQKLHYINNITVPPGNSVSIFAYIGTLSIQRVYSSIQWRQGPCFLIEELLYSQIIAAMYGARPNYIGPFQAVCIDSTNDVFSPLFPKE